MNDEKVERLKAELAVAEAEAVLEQAREAFHDKRTPARVKKFKAESVRVAKLRQAFRLKYPRQPENEGDAVAAPETVASTAGVELR
jgi:hypothetical protein